MYDEGSDGQLVRSLVARQGPNESRMYGPFGPAAKKGALRWQARYGREPNSLRADRFGLNRYSL